MDEQNPPKKKRGRPPLTEEQKRERAANKPAKRHGGKRNLHGVSYLNNDMNIIGHRDERGVRIQKYDDSVGKNKNEKTFKPLEGTELIATYQLAIKNMKRGSNQKKYTTAEQLAQAIIEYWEYLMEQNLKGNPLIPDVEGMATFIGVTRTTLLKYEKSDTPGFAEIVSQAKNDIASCKKQMGQQGLIPPIVMAMDFNNNHGYTQKQEVVVTPNNPLGDRTPTQELMGKYMDLIEDGEKPSLPSAETETEIIEAEFEEQKNGQ